MNQQIDGEVESALRRLPLASPSARLDLRVHAALNDAALTRPLDCRATSAAPADDSSAAGSPRWLAVWLRRARPIGLSAAALIALAFGVGPLLPSRPAKTVSNVTPPQPVIYPAQQITPDLLRDPELSFAPPAYPPSQPSATESPENAPPQVLQPVGLQQTFDRVQDDGVVLIDGATAYQRYRRQAVRRIVVVDPQTGEHATVSIPVQELLVRRVEPN